MADVDEPLSRTTILGLAGMVVAVLIVAIDFTSLPVALPAIEGDLDADVTTVQWVISGYSLVFGVFIVTGGRLADMYGRRRIFFAGAFIFALFSLLGGLAADAWLLLLARGVMGVGGAMMWPSILGMTFALTPASRAGLAGGLFIGAAGFGNTIGPLLGGALTDALSWRWIFFMNLPIAAFATFVTWRVVPDDGPQGRDERIDYGGVLTLSIGLFALLLALDLGTDLGWTSPPILGLFAVTVIGLAAFMPIERRTGNNALIPPDVRGSRPFLAACLGVLLMSPIFFAAMMYLPQFMAKQLGYSAVQAGAGLLPMMGAFTLTSFVAGPLYARIGAKAICAAGAFCLGSGILLLAAIQATTTYPALIPGMIIVGIGVGLFYSSITTAGITAVAPARSSLAGAIIYMFQVAGGAIGLGFNTALVVTAASLSEGIRTAFLVDGVLAIAGLVLTVLFIGGRLDRKQMHSLIHRHRAHG